MTTQIRLNDTRTDVRGGGYGNSAWIARITGTDRKFGLQREFCRADRSGLSGSGRSGEIRFEVARPGVYEFRGFCVGSTARNWEWTGFVRIGEDGEAVEISRDEAVRLAREVTP